MFCVDTILIKKMLNALGKKQLLEIINTYNDKEMNNYFIGILYCGPVRYDNVLISYGIF